MIDFIMLLNYAIKNIKSIDDKVKKFVKANTLTGIEQLYEII